MPTTPINTSPHIHSLDVRVQGLSFNEESERTGTTVTTAAATRTPEQQADQGRSGRSRALSNIAIIQASFEAAADVSRPQLLDLRADGCALSNPKLSWALRKLKNAKADDGSANPISLEPSDKVKEIYENTPIPQITPKCLHDILGNISAAQCRFYGRTLVFEKDGKEYAVKFKKRSERQGLSEEWRAMHRMQKLKKELGLKSDFPDVSDPQKTGVFQLNDKTLPRDFYIALAEQAAKGQFELADMDDMEVLVYEHPEGHHMYLHDPHMSAKDLREASYKYLHDIAILARHNLYHTASGELFHDKDRGDLFHDMEEGRRFHINIDEIADPSSPFRDRGTGRLLAGCADKNDNARKTGVADTKHVKPGTDLPLPIPRLFEADHRYASAKEYESLPKAIAQRSVILENLFTWALGLIRNWKNRLELIEDKRNELVIALRRKDIPPDALKKMKVEFHKFEFEFESMNLPEMLRDGLVTFFSMYTGLNEEDVKEALPLSLDDPENLFIDFDRLYTQVRFFFTDAYAERAEEQPHAVMRKGLARCLFQSDLMFDTLEEEKYKQFCAKADQAVKQQIEPLFDSFDIGIDELGKVLRTYPKDDQQNICQVMNELLDFSGLHSGFHQWLKLLNYTPNMPQLLQQKELLIKELRADLVQALQQKGYQSFDTFLQDVKTLASDSPLDTASISTFPDKKTLTEQFRIFCRTYTDMKEREITGLVQKFSNAYANATENHNTDVLLSQFSEEIETIKMRVEQAATAEVFLSRLNIDFVKVKQDVANLNENSPETTETKKIMTESNALRMIEQHMETFLRRYSTVSEEHKKMLAQAFAQYIPTALIVGKSIGYEDVIQHVFNIDFDNKFGTGTYSKEMWGKEHSIRIIEPMIVDIMDENSARNQNLQRGYLRGQGNQYDGKNRDVGAPGGSFPPTELIVGLKRLTKACQEAKVML